MGILHITLVVTLIMILAMMSTALVSRVLGLTPEDAVLFFAPAGLGMGLAIIALSRWGNRLRHDWLQTGMLFLAALTFGILSLLSRDYTNARIPIFDLYPQRIVPLSTAVAINSIFLGFSLYAINTIAQTTIQRDSLPSLRGRVFTVQFMIANLLGLAPLIAASLLADYLGVPVLLRWLGIACLVVALLTLLSALFPQKRVERTP